MHGASGDTYIVQTELPELLPTRGFSRFCDILRWNPHFESRQYQGAVFGVFSMGLIVHVFGLIFSSVCPSIAIMLRSERIGQLPLTRFCAPNIDLLRRFEVRFLIRECFISALSKYSFQIWARACAAFGTCYLLLKLTDRRFQPAIVHDHLHVHSNAGFLAISGCGKRSQLVLKAMRSQN